MAASLAGVSQEVLAALPAHVLQAAMEEAAAAMAAEPAPLPPPDHELPPLYSPKQEQLSPLSRRASTIQAPAPHASADADADTDEPLREQSALSPVEEVAATVAAAAVATGIAVSSRRASQRQSAPLSSAESQALDAALAQELGESLDGPDRGSTQWVNAHNLLRDEAERLAREEAERVALEELRVMSVKAEQRQSDRVSSTSKDKERIRTSLIVGDNSAVTLVCLQACG
jgi:hypothetical protein